ncbi:MAG: hypothetical protein RBR78_04835 [Flavobacteriaceae bacterium]|jgi:hypothetical protein|nr:hypothetical protein [Flavobacteriaceae bacterium]
MKNITLIFSLFILTPHAFAQVGIGNTSPRGALEVTSSDTGFIAPQASLTDTGTALPVINPQGGALAAGTIVYNTNTANDVTPGYYYWDGSIWVRMAAATATPNNGWEIMGNNNVTSGIHFLGTTNTQALDFRTNNTLRFRVANANQVHAMANGTDAAPFYSWASNPNTGLYASGLDDMLFSTGGVPRGAVWFDGSWWFVNGPANDDHVYIEAINKTTRNRGAFFGSTTNTQNGNGLGSAEINYGDLQIFGSTGRTYSFAQAGYYQTSSNANRSGGTIGAYMNTSTTPGTMGAMGALGYRASNNTFYGVYGFGIAPQTGAAAGFSEGNVNYSVGVAGYGGLLGSWSRGHIIGSLHYGEMISSLNIGNEITSGKNIEIVETQDERIAVYTTSSTENQIYKSGTAKLVNGKAVIKLDNGLVKLIDKQSAPVITVTAMGKSGVLYIDSFRGDEFTVMENGDMNSTVDFNWILIANRVDGQNHFVSPEILDKSFDKNVIKSMTNETDENNTDVQLWYDGQKLRFDLMPDSYELKNTRKWENRDVNTNTEKTKRLKGNESSNE